MARLTLALLVILFALSYQVPSMESRKLFNADQKKEVFSLKDNLVATDVSKKPAVDSPVDEDHMMAKNEKLIADHLAKIDRMLQSQPSPGAGH
ncbi:hypothetical protein COLO4_17491 [Corchorus olitorius]|uniref:Uncharacterized protein n=1 Tax=Corchorus olitorius TaxID=93759 RepID=A0A1R3JCH9_9ROSI|nr:hypothetical protein COLO4_17491 [Corchorus olitorius]